MKTIKPSAGGHTWRFFRAGGFDQVRIDSVWDLNALDTLDQKLWVALACPVDNLFFDTRTLALIDTDGDRRIRAGELISAIKWTIALLKNPDDLTAVAPDFILQTINDATDEGKAIALAMKNVLKALGKKETDSLTITDIESIEKILSKKPCNGDGIIIEDTADTDEVRNVIREIIATLGAVTDRSGKPGVNLEKVETFFGHATAYEKWYSESERDPAIRPLGDATEKAAQAIAAVREKISDYFARVAVAGYDDNATALMNGGEKQYEAMGVKTLSLQSVEITGLPLAKILPDNPLTFGATLNPAWVDSIKNFEKSAVIPLLGPKERLTRSEWQGLLKSFDPWFSWLTQKPGPDFDAAGIVSVRELLKSPLEKTLHGLIERDLAESATFASLISLEKLARFRRDLFALCTNFVNFKDFYSKSGAAIFQAGTLYLDQRSCNLCIKIDDPARNAQMAAMAGSYLVYCDCRRRAGADKMAIVAAFTNGDSDNLIVGRNGVFYDRKGNDWDATIVKIIENPISLRQAFWLPYKNLVRMIEAQVARRATAADAQSTSKLEQTAVATANIETNKPAPPPKKLDVGTVAALGVAAGALGTFVAALLGYVSGIVKLGPLAIIAAFAGLLLLISAPSLILAYIKLRKRSLGPILDASGWAINAKARINVPFGTALTHIATLPKGTQRDLIDPYAEKKSPWPKVVVGAVVVYIIYFVLNSLGFINEWTDGRLGRKKEHTTSTTVIENKTVTKTSEIK